MGLFGSLGGVFAYAACLGDSNGESCMECWVKRIKMGTGLLGFSGRSRVRGAFTLIELLTVVSVISILVAISVPVIESATHKARTVQKISNQRNTVISLNLFASNNRDYFPPSIATTGVNDEDWDWADPRLMVGYPDRYAPRKHRSMSYYLKSYLPDPGVLICENSPNKYEYLNEMWEAGDDWDNPETSNNEDPMTGTFCFYWNYRGWLTDREQIFKGPVRASGGRGYSKMLLGDYFGSDMWRNAGQYGSCDSFKKARVTQSTDVHADFWTGGSIYKAVPEIRLTAAFVDGHVESYLSTEVVKMEVSRNQDGSPPPFEEQFKKGNFYIPLVGLP